MTTKTIRWVLAHEPLDIFLRAAKRFAEQVSHASNGDLTVEILSLKEYAQKYNNGVDVSYLDLVEYLNEGKLEMSQMYTHSLGKFSPQFRALDLPFLFKDDNHAERVLDGEIGKDILSTLAAQKETKNVKGLAFTYSGGFTVISANRPINSANDLKGLKVRVPYSPVIYDYFEELGMEPTMIDLQDLSTSFANKKIDAAEITYRRLYESDSQRYTDSVLHSHHNLFLTSIIINQDFYATLSKELQTIIAESALLAAQKERDEAIEDDAVHQGYCLKDGIVVNTLSFEMEKEFQRRSVKTYLKWQDVFGKDFIKKIKSA